MVLEPTLADGSDPSGVDETEPQLGQSARYSRPMESVCGVTGIDAVDAAARSLPVADVSFRKGRGKEANLKDMG